jgi:hypothetical protein
MQGTLKKGALHQRERKQVPRRGDTATRRDFGFAPVKCGDPATVNRWYRRSLATFQIQRAPDASGSGFQLSWDCKLCGRDPATV